MIYTSLRVNLFFVSRQFSVFAKKIHLTKRRCVNQRRGVHKRQMCNYCVVTQVDPCCDIFPYVPVQYHSWNGLLLVFSNLTFIVCAIVLMIQSIRISAPQPLKRWQTLRYCWKWAWEIMEYGMVTMISALYHRCDTPGWKSCVVGFDALQFMDFFISFLLFTTAISPHLPNVTIRSAYKVFMTMLTLSLILFYYTQSVITIIILAILNSTMFLAFNWQRLHWKNLKETKCTWFLVPACLFLIAAVLMKFMSTQVVQTTSEGDNYDSSHGMWHIFAALASACIHLSIDPTRYQQQKTDSETNAVIVVSVVVQ